MKTINLLNVLLHNVSYSDILDSIQQTIQNQKQLAICYANVNSINLTTQNHRLKNLFSEFDIVHADGLGIFFGSKILYGKDGLTYRLNGSDLYNRLINDCYKYYYRLFFLGDKNETLIEIKKKHPQLNLVGIQNGFEFDSAAILKLINRSETNILIVGLGTPKQEEWIVQNKKSLRANVIISVGDGIKVFSGTKRRGPKFLQIIGLEWTVRLFFEPRRLWKRYIIGIPLFIFRIVKFKFLNSKTV